MLYRVHLTWVELALTTLEVIGTDCIGSYKSNWHMITTTTAPVMVSMLDSSAIDVDQINVYRTGICCFLGKQTAYRSKSHMPTHRLLLQWARTIYKDPTMCWSSTKRTSISSHWNVTYFHHDIYETFTHLALNNNHSHSNSFSE